MKRQAGILLHPTSLPSPYGIGDLGPAAYRFVDWLKQSGQRLWQVLPLTIPDATDSPYAASSSRAGNWLLISPELLVTDGLLEATAVPRPQPVRPVHYPTVRRQRTKLIKQSFNYFQQHGSAKLKKEWTAFRQRETYWLHNFALFMALRDRFHGQHWYRWPAPLVCRHPAALRRYEKQLKKEMDIYAHGQWLFFRQWQHLKQYANNQGIRIIGDLPFFVVHDSVDVWAHQSLFRLDKRRMPTSISGVPPDYFSRRGQIWGDPHYDWNHLEKTNFSWWISRFTAAFRLFDLLRVDHFRGYRAVWHIKPGRHTARDGWWGPVPGEQLLRLVRRRLRRLPLIAEDLGIITDDVIQMRKQFNLPGMRVLQFAFDGSPDNLHLPIHYPKNCVAYTGTHDNDTSRGWITSSGLPHEIKNALHYTDAAAKTFAWELIKIGMRSKAGMFITPLQDVLNLGPDARMNVPGTRQGNWQWRLRANLLTTSIARRLRQITKSAKR